jgi:hypothetical protein
MGWLHQADQGGHTADTAAPGWRPSQQARMGFGWPAALGLRSVAFVRPLPYQVKPPYRCAADFPVWSRTCPVKRSSQDGLPAAPSRLSRRSAVLRPPPSSQREIAGSRPSLDCAGPLRRTSPGTPPPSPTPSRTPSSLRVSPAFGGMTCKLPTRACSSRPRWTSRSSARCWATARWRSPAGTTPGSARP